LHLFGNSDAEMESLFVIAIRSPLSHRYGADRCSALPALVESAVRRIAVIDISMEEPDDFGLESLVGGG
jgi:hypothetical protein